MEDRDSPLPHIDSQMPDTDGGFLDMMYGENEGGNVYKDCTEINMVQEEHVQDMEPEPATKKRSRVPKQKSKRPATKNVQQNRRSIPLTLEKVRTKKKETNEDRIGRSTGL